MPVNKDLRKTDWSVQEILNLIAIDMNGDKDPDAIGVYIEGIVGDALSINTTTEFLKVTGSVDLSEESANIESAFGKKKQIVGIYVNISSSKERDVIISVIDNSIATPIEYIIIQKLGKATQNIVIADKFDLDIDQEITIQVGQAATPLEDDGILNYRIDAIDKT